MGGEFQINSDTLSYQAAPSVALGADGDFVVVWVKSVFVMPFYLTSVQGRRFAPLKAHLLAHKAAEIEFDLGDNRVLAFGDGANRVSAEPKFQGLVE